MLAKVYTFGFFGGTFLQYIPIKAQGSQSDATVNRHVSDSDKRIIFVFGDVAVK